MNQGFKQRLVGAVVLACIALILWPVLFSENAGPIMDRTSQIPPTPAFEKYEVPQPVRPQKVVPVREVEVETAPPEDQAPLPVKVKEPAKEAVKPLEENRASEKPALNEQNLPQGWVLQVASFSQQQNAQDMQAELQKMGYKAFTRTITTSQGKAVRVYVGPKFSKGAFTKDRAEIDKKFKVKSIVVTFQQ